MADQLTEALGFFVANCPHVRSTRDMASKVRVELERDYVLDLYFRETTGQYSYTLLLNDRRVLGWDNAKHHPDLQNAPHHFHKSDGGIESSTLTGKPVEDIKIVADKINDFFKLFGVE
ncbi:MAG: hypothetical protein HZB17_01020 [Chloroflexi bacterium]|nr:hypothetical protein [Chloroflexota bacterium]MBI5079875.1 hypothetical protein [Chloroflexota bacterium]